MLASADSGVEVLTKGANDSGTALGKQVDDGTESFSKLPAPIGQAMQGYLKPFQTGYAAKLDAMTKAIDAAGVSFGQVFETGHGGGDGKTATGGEGKTATGGEGKTGAKGPEMAPQKFLDLANKIAPHPEADDDIAAFAVLAHKLVNTNVTNRANELYGALQAFSTSVDTVMRNLRGLTKKRGDALRWWYESHEGHGNLEASLRRELFKTFSADSTNYLNIDAAIAHLNGDEAKAAMLELKAAVNYSNENKRVEEVMRSLSPADLKKLRELPDAQKDLDAIAEDLGGTEETVFNLLRNVDEQHPDNIAQANAIRLKESVDTARKEMGDKGGDQTFDAIKAAAVNAGNDPISGADPLGLDTDETRKARNADTWKRTLQAFDKMEPVPKGEAPPVEGPGAGLYSYATRTRNYYVTTGYGEGAETEIVPQGLSKYQALSIQKLLTSKEGPDSDEVAAARLAVEMNREGGKPDRDKLDAVMHDKSLDQREGEVLTEAQEAERQAKAEARFKRIFSLYEDYTIPKDPTTGKDLEPRRTPEAVQADVVDKVGKAYGNDKEGKLAQSSVKSPGGDPVAVLEYAMDDPKANVDLLKKQMGRMNADQIDAAVKTYEKNHPGEQSVNAKLGIFNEGDHSVEGFFRGAGPALSGDKRNDVEIAFMGVPRTDLERAQVARMIAKQQIDQSGWAGRHLASHEYGNLVRSANDLRDQMGLTQEQYDKSFDAKGRMVYTDPLTGKPGKPVPIGNFSADGKFTPTTKGAAEAFDLACGMTRLEATTYKDATDRIATYITTALVIAAAAITTALTFGAAASIWIPVLVTAGAGLLGMGASRLIKGERYGRDEMIHDLAMTVIQAATAGIGAAAGAAMRGGLPALRAVGGAFKVSEKALETAVEAGGGTLAKSLTIGQDLAIAGGTGAFAGGTSALLDEEARKKYGTFGAVFHGATRGGVGSLAGAGFGKLGGGAIGRLTGRSESFLATGAVRLASSGASGYGQSLTESTYSALVEGRPMTAAEAFEAAKWMALQNVAQSTGEHGLEGGVKARQARAAGVEPHVAVPEHVAPSEVPTAPREAPAAPRETLPPSAGHPPEEIAPHPELATRPPPVAAPIEAPRPPPLPRAANDNEPVTRRGPAPVEEEPATPRLPAPTEEEPVTQRRPAPAEDEAVTQRVPRPGAEEEAPAARPHPAQQPEPEWLAQQKHLPPGSVVIDPEPTNPRRALDDYKERIRESPNREVAIYRNAETGQFIVVQGNENSAFVAILKSGKHEAPMPGGRKQGWKAVLLGHDVGNWQLVAHFHPVEGGGNTAGMPRRLPSGKGGDLSAMAYESRAAGGAARQSRVNYLDNGELRHTDFGFDPHLDGGPYWVEFEHPVTGVREKHPFPTTKAYHDFFEDVTGRPMREIGTATPAASEPAKPVAAPREDDYVFYHGTTAKGQAAIEEKGVTAQRNTGVGDDYSAAFYVTPQEAVGGEYARQRSASAARAGEPSEGRVLAFRVSREDMGAVVDIRPGGEHRAAFEAFMNGPSPFADPRLPGLGHLPQTVGEYVVTFGHDRRGEYFEKFLASIGMSHADAIHGDLGGIGTAGIGGGHPGAEQIAIRSQRLADLLTAQLPGRAPIVPDLPEVPRAAGPGPVGPREAPTRGEPGSVGTTGPVHEPGVAARAQAAADRLTEELAGGRRAAGSGSGGGMPPEREAPTPRPNVADLDESFERTFSHEPPNEPEPPTPPAPVGAERPTGPLFVDIQGGAAVRADTGEPTFLPSLVAQTPGARGVLLEPADFIPGYAGITTTNERDLALARILAQNMPQWPEGPAIGPTPVATNEGDRALLRILAEHLPPWPEPSGIGAQPRPWEWDPSLAFPTQGPVQVLTRPGPPGTTPEPQAFFPPIGHDVVPGIPRLIPIAIGEEQAQRDVARLRPGSHPELHGEVDRAYWRRPFAMSSATPEVTAAMGQEQGIM